MIIKTFKRNQIYIAVKDKELFSRMTSPYWIARRLNIIISSSSDISGFDIFKVQFCRFKVPFLHF